MYTTFITVNKKSVRIEINDNEAKERANKMRYINRIQDEKMRAAEEERKRRGVCPQCRLTLPLSKYCFRCGNTYN